MTNKVDAHKKLCNQLTDTYVRKNHDYGDAFGKSIEEHGLIAGVVRMEDKFNRLKNIIKTNEVLVGDEKLEDTLLDLANYTIMMVIELQCPESPGEFEHDRWNELFKKERNRRLSENTTSYNEEPNPLRQEVEHYRQEVEYCRQEIKELRLENARLGALVDARFTEHDWFESVGTE